MSPASRPAAAAAAAALAIALPLSPSRVCLRLRTRRRRLRKSSPTPPAALDPIWDDMPGLPARRLGNDRLSTPGCCSPTRWPPTRPRGPDRNDHRARPTPLGSPAAAARSPRWRRQLPAPSATRPGGRTRWTPRARATPRVRRRGGRRPRRRLARAPRADLPASTVAAIEDRIGRTVAGKFWRYPAIRLNQINWYGLMYAASATVNGRDTLLRHDLALQIRRFVRGIGGRGHAAGNLGPGARFHYLPQQIRDGPHERRLRRVRATSSSRSPASSTRAAPRGCTSRPRTLRACACGRGA